MRKFATALILCGLFVSFNASAMLNVVKCPSRDQIHPVQIPNSVNVIFKAKILNIKFWGMGAAVGKFGPFLGNGYITSSNRVHVVCDYKGGLQMVSTPSFKKCHYLSTSHSRIKPITCVGSSPLDCLLFCYGKF